MDKYIGYELRVRVTFPATDVDIVSFLDEINSNGTSRVKDVVLLDNEAAAEKFLNAIGEEKA